MCPRVRASHVCLGVSVRVYCIFHLTTLPDYSSNDTSEKSNKRTKGLFWDAGARRNWKTNLGRIPLFASFTLISISILETSEGEVGGVGGGEGGDFQLDRWTRRTSTRNSKSYDIVVRSGCKVAETGSRRCLDFFHPHWDQQVRGSSR